jgi:hypothetical protein
MKQNLPKPGQQDVPTYAEAEFRRMFRQRNAEGVETYGTPLQTFNARNTFQDLKEELLDAWNYVCELELEFYAAVALLKGMINEVSDVREDRATCCGPDVLQVRSEE